MDKLLERLTSMGVHGDAAEVCDEAAKLLREFRTAAQSLIDGDPTLDPSELIEKHRAWFKELLA